MSLPRIVTCPTCRRRGDWFATDSGPFCSPRCKLLDLGKWLGGEHVIGTPLRAEDFEGLDEVSSRPNPDRDEPAA